MSSGRRAGVERDLLERRLLAVDEAVDQRLARGHALDELEHQALPVGQIGIGNGPDDGHLVLRRHREHLGHQVLGALGIDLQHAGHEADVDARLIEIAEQAEVAHGVDGGRHLGWRRAARDSR